MSNKDANTYLTTSYTYYDANPTKNHLLNVYAYLQSRHIVNEQRTKNLAILYKYIQAEKYPVNTYSKNYVPIFIDAKQNNYCAVGHIIKETGYDELAKQINTAHHFDYLKNIKTKGVSEWLAQCGFSFEELELIQPAYAPSTPTYSIGSGVNGVINSIVDLNHRYPIIIGGLFNRAGDKTCSNLAYYNGESLTDDSWRALGNGTNGVVNILKLVDNKLYVGGKFTSINGLACNNFAILNIQDLNNITYEVTDGVDDEVYDIEEMHNNIYLCGKFSSKLARLNNGYIEPLPGLFFGVFKSLEVFSNILYIGGDFTTIRGEHQNIVKHNGLNYIYSTQAFPKKIASLCRFKNKLYIGVNSSSITDSLLYMYDGFIYSTAKFEININLYGNEINNLINIEDSILITSGSIYYPMLSITNSVYEFKDGDSGLSVLPYVINIIGNSKSVSYTDDRLFICGDFLSCSTSGGIVNRNNIFTIDNYLGLFNNINQYNNDSKNENNILIYTNPTSNYINIYSEKKIKKYTISDITGNKINNLEIYNNQIDVSTLSTGMYFIEIETDEGVAVKRFVKY